MTSGPSITYKRKTAHVSGRQANQGFSGCGRTNPGCHSRRTSQDRRYASFREAEIKLGVGGGSVVKDLNADQVSEGLALLIRSQKVSLNHLAEFREDVEGIVAAHAAKRRTKEDILKLYKLVEAARNCVEGGTSQRNAFIEIDKQIHMTLAQAAKNPIYISVLHSVHENIHRYYERFLSMEERELQENHQDLCDLVKAVEKRQADHARQLARNHVQRFNQYMKTREQAEKKRT